MIFYGRNVALEALKSNFSVKKIVMDSQTKESPKILRIKQIAQEKNITLQQLPRQQIKALTNSNEHQGVAIEVDLKVTKLDKKSALHNTDTSFKRFIYITEANHDHNIGAIIRSAEASGCAGVILPKSTEISGVIGKTSTGALFNIPLYKESLFNTIKKFEKETYNIYAIERNGRQYDQVDLKGPALFLIGGENKSISEQVREKCTTILEIPQRGKVNSLNMSVAASIILFEGLVQEINFSQ